MVKKTDKAVNNNKLQVKVRMYCHGLGDCFLLTFKRGGETRNMMIDCGVLQGTEDGESKIIKVVEDIKAQTRRNDKTPPRLDVVAVTHQHWDHISGFQQAQEHFNEIEFGEIWLAWTEDPNNALAKDLNKGLNARLHGMQTVLNKVNGFNLDKDHPRQKECDEVQRILEGFFGENFGAVSVDSMKLAETEKGPRVKAWEYVLTKHKPNKPKYHYCYPGREPLTFEGFEGIRVYVLGPPTDAAKIRSLSPPSTERYRHTFNINTFSLEDSFFFAVNDKFDSRQRNSCRPFDEENSVVIDEDDAKKQGAKYYKFFQEFYHEKSDDWRRIKHDWLSMTSELALKLDSYTNNTSLVLAIELIESGKVLLFVGDAQSGNWESWHDHDWEVPDKNGKKQKIDAENLLGRTVLYKVGHHGSHNATLKKSGLEMMKRQSELVAMIPVDTEKAHSKNPIWEMPFDALLDDLLSRTNGRVLASDRGQVKKAGLDYPDWDGYTKDEENLLKYDGGKPGKCLFIDYEIEG